MAARKKKPAKPGTRRRNTVAAGLYIPNPPCVIIEVRGDNIDAGLALLGQAVIIARDGHDATLKLAGCTATVKVLR